MKTILVPQKSWHLSTKLHGVTTQKTIMFVCSRVHKDPLMRLTNSVHYLNPISLKTIPMLFSNICKGLPNGFFPSRFYIETFFKILP
jgi:hypothetical protein